MNKEPERKNFFEKLKTNLESSRELETNRINSKINSTIQNIHEQLPRPITPRQKRQQWLVMQKAVKETINDNEFKNKIDKPTAYAWINKNIIIPKITLLKEKDFSQFNQEQTKIIQNILYLMGEDISTQKHLDGIDGKYGDKTKNAVIKIQKYLIQKNFLPNIDPETKKSSIDGKMGKKTLQALEKFINSANNLSQTSSSQIPKRSLKENTGETTSLSRPKLNSHK